MSKQQVLDYIQKLRIHNSESQTPMPDQYFVELIRMVEQLG